MKKRLCAVIACATVLTALLLGLLPHSAEVPISFLGIPNVGRAEAATSQDYVGTIVYPFDIDTDYEKLEAVYSLIEQMRLEHNRVGEIARSNWEEYEDKWYEYARIFKTKLQPLLEELNKLRASIKDANFTQKEWRELDSETQLLRLDALLPDKEVAKTELTSATTLSLDQLKDVDFYSLDGKFVDPVEDFTSASWNNGTPQVDPNSRYTVDSNTVTATDITRDETAYFYRAHNISGDFEWLFTTAVTDGSGGGVLPQPSLGDEIGNDRIGEVIETFWYVSGSTERFYIMYLSDASLEDYDYNQPGGSPTIIRYITLDRTGTTFTARMYTDAERTSLSDTISCTVPSMDFPYIYAARSSPIGDASDVISCYLEDWDLQEAEPSLANTPSSENLGNVDESSTYYAYGSAPSNPVQDGECTFTITNDGSISIDIDIKATNFTGGSGWTLTSGSPGSGTVRVTAYYSGQNPASGVILTTGDQEFYTGLAASGTLKWDFKLETGTFTDGVGKSSTITLSASAS